MSSKNKKNPRSRPADDSVKHDISSAVDQIPHLIFQSIHDEEIPKKDTPRVSASAIRAYQLRKKDQDQAKKKLLVVGVACITVIIVAMWAWNMRIFWYRTQEITKDEPALWDTSKEDLSSILKNATAQKEAIDELLKKIDNEGAKKEDAVLTDAFKSLIAMTATSTTSTVPTTTTPMTAATSTVATPTSTTSTNQ